MSIIIVGGAGKLNPVGVTDDNHLEASARVHARSDAETRAGNAYNWNSKEITVTGAAFTQGILYMKNTSSDTYVIDKFFYILGASTSGTGGMLVEILRNPTAGTVVSGITTLAPINRNFGSSNTLTGDFYVGADGETITDGVVAVETHLQTGSGRSAISIELVITPGSSFGIRYTTQTSNSSQIAMFAVSIYKSTLD